MELPSQEMCVFSHRVWTAGCVLYHPLLQANTTLPPLAGYSHLKMCTTTVCRNVTFTV